MNDKRYRRISLLGLVCLAMASLVHADERAGVIAYGWFDFTDLEGEEDLGGWTEQTLPQSEYSPGVWTRGFSTQDPDYGMRVSTNAEGRVRASAKTGSRLNGGPAFGHAGLVWEGTFVRGNGANPTFTLNPSHVQVIAEVNGRGELLDRNGEAVFFGSDGEQFTPPFAVMDFTVNVYKIDPVSGDTISDHRILRLDADLRGIPGSKFEPLDVDPKATGINFLVLDGKTFHPVLENGKKTPLFIDTQRCFLTFGMANPTCWADGKTFVGMRYDLVEKYTEEILLDDLGIEAGDTYMVQYILWTKAGEDDQEHRAEAFLGDPLDIDPSVVSLETTDELIELPRPISRSVRDPDRYPSAAGETSVDAATGLMWSTCPIGYTFDDPGTPADRGDDRCRDTGNTIAFTWKEALALSKPELAGFSDWRLPNVKELNSLRLADARSGALAPEVSPDGRATYLWTSTPFVRADDMESWAVDFGFGDVFPEARDSMLGVRLVRDTDEGPQPQRPQLRVHDAAVEEGATGEQSVAEFRVTLTSPLATDLTLGYQTSPSTAGDVDFTPASGSFDIPAGSLEAFVGVSVTGDGKPEPNEKFWLDITGVPETVYPADTRALGAILDDEPTVQAMTKIISVHEGDTGETAARVRIALDSPPSEDVFLNYSLNFVGATPSVDFVDESDVLTFATGATGAEFDIRIIGDQEHENDEEIIVELSDPIGLNLPDNLPPIVVAIVDDDGPDTYGNINDSGIRRCANGVTTALTCPVADFPLQDAETGRDVLEADQSDGDAGFSFTKLDSSGSPVPYTSGSFDCVRDETTSLVWEIKTFAANDLRNYTDTYSWRVDGGINDGGNPGIVNAGVCASGIDCDTQAYVDAINAANYCGFNDWRLPTIAEAFDLTNFAGTVDVDQSNGLDILFAPHGETFWTGTPYATNSDRAWMMIYDNDDATVAALPKSIGALIRLVRGGRPQS